MLDDTVHLGDIGTSFQIKLIDATGAAIDISAATGNNDKFVLFKKPSITTVQQSGLFVTDGTDGKIQHTAISGDINEAGTWQLQGWVRLVGGSWYSDVSEFKVSDNVVQVTGI